MNKNLALLFLMIILLTACSGTSSTISLSDTTWKLLSYGAIDNPTPALPKVATSISFNADGNIKGNVGCNGFAGPYKISGNKIELGPLMSTEMYCEGTMDQEMAVLTPLNGTLTFESDGDILTIYSEDGNSALQLMRIER